MTDRTDRVPSAATVTFGAREPNSLPRRRRRRRAAPAGRVAATGLSASALLGIVGVMGAHASPTGATAKLASTRSIEPTAASARRGAPPTTIVWRVVHRVVVVNDLPPVDGAGHGGRAASSGASVPRSPDPVSSSPPTVAPPPPSPPPTVPVCKGSKCP